MKAENEEKKNGRKGWGDGEGELVNLQRARSLKKKEWIEKMGMMAKENRWMEICGENKERETVTVKSSRGSCAERQWEVVRDKINVKLPVSSYVWADKKT